MAAPQNIDREAAEAVVDVLKRLYERGLVQVRGGNVSYLAPDGLIYITPTGTPRHKLTWRDAAVMTLDGKVVAGRPSSEWRMHIEIYKRLDEVNSVVHAHPRSVLAAAEAGIPLNPDIFTEARYSIGCISWVERIEPGTQELADSVASTLHSTGCRAAVLKGHGAVTVANDPYRALDAMEALEDLAWITLILQEVQGRCRG